MPAPSTAPLRDARSLLRRAIDARLSGVLEFGAADERGCLVLCDGRVAWADGLVGMPSLAQTLAKLAGVSPLAIARRALDARDKGLDLPGALNMDKSHLRAAMRDYLSAALRAALAAHGSARFLSQPIRARAECCFSFEELLPYTHGMPAEQAALRSILEPGQIEACALIDARSNELLTAASLASSRDLELAAVLASTVIGASEDALRAEEGDELDDVVIAGRRHFRILRPLSHAPGHFLYAEVCRGTASLALARRTLGELASKLLALREETDVAAEAG